MQTRTRLTITSPLEAVVAELRQWRKHGHWWEPDSEDRLDGLTVPGDTRQDWEHSFGELASLVFGGLHIECHTVCADRGGRAVRALGRTAIASSEDRGGSGS